MRVGSFLKRAKLYFYPNLYNTNFVISVWIFGISNKIEVAINPWRKDHNRQASSPYIPYFFMTLNCAKINIPSIEIYLLVVLSIISSLLCKIFKASHR